VFVALQPRSRERLKKLNSCAQVLKLLKRF